MYPYYWPHYKAGGPVQSLFNLADFLKDKTEVFILSKANDIDNTPMPDSTCLNNWIDGPNREHIIYQKTITPWSVFNLLQLTKPDIVLVNGIFNASTTLPGIFFCRWQKIKLIFSPRGMLQPWGLNRNRRQKKIYLFILKLFLPETMEWHATDQMEKQDIIREFGDQRPIHIASNIPRKIIPFQNLKWRTGNEKIKLIFLSLINPNKNLHTLIDVVKQRSDHFSLDIYGPIASHQYWFFCQEKMKGTLNIEYHGSIEPWQVQKLLGQFHFFVLLTLGENFGHAIFDALSSSVPVIISKKTPWSGIEDNRAGYYLDMDKGDENDLISVLDQIQKMDESTYFQFRKSAHAYAEQYWQHSHFSQHYYFLI